MDSLKRRQAAQAGTTTRIFKQLQKAQLEDHSALNIPKINRQLASLATANEAYKALYAEIEEKSLEDYEAEEDILAQHLDAYEEAETLGHFLLSIGSVLNNARSLKEQVRELEQRQMIQDYPDKSTSRPSELSRQD